jgi:hypothetical protein
MRVCACAREKRGATARRKGAEESPRDARQAVGRAELQWLVGATRGSAPRAAGTPRSSSTPGGSCCVLIRRKCGRRPEGPTRPVSPQSSNNSGCAVTRGVLAGTTSFKGARTTSSRRGDSSRGRGAAARGVGALPLRGAASAPTGSRLEMAEPLVRREAGEGAGSSRSFGSAPRRRPPIILRFRRQSNRGGGL